MKLVNKDGMPVFRGDVVFLERDGEVIPCKVTDLQEPHKPSSTGRVYVEEIETGWKQGYFPSVFGMVWVGRRDQNQQLLTGYQLAGIR